MGFLSMCAHSEGLLWVCQVHNSPVWLLLAMRASPDAVFKSLADPTRRAILERLIREGELTVGVITGESGVSQPMVSKHLAVLKSAGLVRDRRAGRETHYSAQPRGL